MKYFQLTLKIALGAIIAAVMLQGCSKDSCEVTDVRKQYKPIYMPYDELRSAVASEQARSLENPGKIYFQGDYLFINERDKGIHVIDNRNLSSPVNVAFINIPGNRDIAVLGNILYADSYIDLVAIDISDPSNVSEAKRLEDVLPHRMVQGSLTEVVDDSKGVVAGFEVVETTETYEVDCSGNSGGGRGGWMDEGVVIDAVPGTFTTNDATSGPELSSVGDVARGGGSMARFTMVDDYLYVIDHSRMQLFDISSPANFSKSHEVRVGWDIETIFPYRNKLFIGSMTGMHIYDNSDPSNPQYLSTYSHITGCDPVVVEGDLAYVTLRGGTPCATFNNQLDVVDISNPSQPTLKVTHEMHNPHGLGIDRGTLFICDGTEGLKVFDATDPMKINEIMIDQKSGIQAYDVIPRGTHLFMIGEDGFYQYNYQDLDNIFLLSSIPVN